MRRTKTELLNPRQTAAEMARLSTQYAADLGEKAHWPLEKFFSYVKHLPYRRDPKNLESLARPALTMQARFPWRDCDDKAILLGAWCASNFVPFRFVASSKRPDKVLHHVYLEAQGAKPIILDATYSHNRLGAPAADYTHIEPLTGWIMPQIQVLEGDLGFLPKSLTRPVKRIGRKAVNTALTPVRVAKRGGAVVSRVIGRAMPGPIRRAVERAVKKIVGNQKVTPALKAAIIAPATAAALAVPGVQPYAVAVPVVLNQILDAMIAQAKTRRTTGPGGGSMAALREKLVAAKATAKTVLEAKRAAVATPQKKIPVLAIGAIGAGAAVLALLAFRGKK